MTPHPFVEAADLLACGRLVLVPSEIGHVPVAHPGDSEALARLLGLGGADGRVVVLVPSFERVHRLAARVPNYARALAEALWPGPVTLLLPARPGLAPELTRAGTVAVRIPSHAIARALLHELGAREGASATLATVEGPSGPAFATPEAARAALGEAVAVPFSGEAIGPGSTTLVECLRASPRILAVGRIAPDRVQAVVGMPVVQAAVG